MGASFFQELHDGTGGGYPGETLESIWNLVWRGLLTERCAARVAGLLRADVVRREIRAMPSRHGGCISRAGFRSRRTTPPTAQGRWALNAVAFEEGRSATEWSHAIAQQLLARYGVVFRETAHAEGLPGGFSAIYDVMKALEESWQGAARLLRRRPGGDAVCHAGRGRPAAVSLRMKPRRR